jgi:hypothetical protein
VDASAKCNASCLVCNVVIYMCVSPDRSYIGVGGHVLCDMCLIPLGLHRFTSFVSTHYGGRHCIRSFLGTAEFTKLKVNLDWRKHHAQDNVPDSYHPGLTPSNIRKKNNLGAAATIVGEPAQNVIPQPTWCGWPADTGSMWPAQKVNPQPAWVGWPA